MVICLERGADLHMAQVMPLPLTVSCFSKIQIGFTFLVPAHPGSPGQRAVKRGCVCVCVIIISMLPRLCWSAVGWIRRQFSATVSCRRWHSGCDGPAFMRRSTRGVATQSHSPEVAFSTCSRVTSAVVASTFLARIWLNSNGCLTLLEIAWQCSTICH